jgi:tRNA threonylcarbamoyladenosine biosynthesis protein TsaB
MLLLALDTSTRYSSVALCSENEFLGEYTWYSGNNHSVELFEYIQRLCMQAQVSLQRVELIAVAIGPGSFNGVRVALACAKALAFALRKPLVGVSTLDIIAFQQSMYGVQRPVCALLEAGRSGGGTGASPVPTAPVLYAATYMFDELRSAHGELSYRMKRFGDYLLVTPEQLVAYLQEHALDWFMSAVEAGQVQDTVPTVSAFMGVGQVQDTRSAQDTGLVQGTGSVRGTIPTVLFCGEISASTHQVLRSSLPEQSLFVRGAQAARRAVSLATIALQQMREGHTDDPLTLEPLYLRRPSITKSTRKQPLLGDTIVGAGQEPCQGGAPTGQHAVEREDSALRH